MATRTAGARKAPFLPAGVGEAIRRFAVESAGIALGALALLALAALASYAPSDPSWNTAADGAALNWAGRDRKSVV